MAMKSFGLAATGLICSFSVSLAQPEKPSIPAEQQQLLKALTQQHAKSASAAAPNVPATMSKAAAGKAISLGWHFAHATNCGWFTPGNGDQWFYIFPSEGGSIFVINNLHASQGLQVPCSNGNWIGWHVIDASTGAFDQTQSFDFK